MTWNLTGADYPSIRAAIDTSLSAGSLPDDVIALQVYVGAAEQWVRRRVPTADTESAAVQNHIHLAAIYYCAAALVFALPSFTKETGPEFEAVIQRIDPRSLAADLRARAEDELLAGLPASVLPASVMFTVAPGSRGRW